MHAARTFCRPALLALLGYCCPATVALAADKTPANEVIIIDAPGTVELLQPVPGAVWVITGTNQILRPGYRLRTRANSRAALLWSDNSVTRFGALTEIEIRPPHAPDAEPGLHLLSGIFSFFHRDPPGRVRVITRGMAAGIKGTDFAVAVDDQTGRTTIWVIDGIVEVARTDDTDAISIANGEAATVDVGQAPRRAPGFIAENILQWCFYYPAVLDLRELPLSADEQRALDASLAAYRTGDLVAALANYPAGRQPGSEAETIYYAGLLLSVGQAEQSEAALANLRTANNAQIQRLAGALRYLIAAVKRESITPAEKPQLASELLAASYYEQSRAIGEDSLKRVLQLARAATTNSPEFSFAWARVAELEFSFGHTGAALEALEKSLALSQRNAQALALKGFLLAAQNKPRAAIDWFDRAMAVDAALGNAWLGRGLCRIRRGDLHGGRQDLLIAAALEPRRSSLRSYLGKAYGESNDRDRALHELELAQQLDDKDPTAWLYSALVKAEHNRINEAIRDLEHSQDLNDNRSIYRSSLLLDQDRAVRSANLARIYRDAGMTDWSIREAGRAVSADYANYSAHLFLANSYDELRDPNRINLRYETPAESEYLIANLLAPVGAGLLAQSVSQQEYSKLFERDRLGVSSSTEYLSRGAWIEHGAQYGVSGNSSYLFEGLYRTDPGERRNGDFEGRELRLHLKQQLTPQDSIYFRAIDYEADGGDVRQYYDPRSASLRLRTEERQEPILQAGYHHEWSPGVHTLLLAGRLNDQFALDNPRHPTFFLLRITNRPASDFELMYANLRYRAAAEIYSAELQQIWKQGDHNTVMGGRFQAGEIRTKSLQTDQVVLGEINGYFAPNKPLAVQDFRGDFERLSAYAYHDWQIWPALRALAGVAYDRVTFPANFLAPPLSRRENEPDQISPKAGLVWTPGRTTTARFAYARALSGASIDQSFLLEPSQVAGFNQSFRSIVPESVGGSGSGVKMEMFSAALEQKIGTATYLGLAGQILDSRQRRTLGVFRYDRSSFFAKPSGTQDLVDYSENTLVLTLNRLVQDEWSLGASYRLTYARLEDDFLEVPASTYSLGVRPKSDVGATLHQVLLQAVWQHPSGLFGQFQALWSEQYNQGYVPGLPGDDFWQLNVFAGYRFPRRQAELRVGLLNLADQDYRLNPITLYHELPRSRTLSVRFQFHF